jgi:hypothetical protein
MKLTIQRISTLTPQDRLDLAPATLPGLWSKPASIAEKASITRWPGGEKPAIKT